MHRGRKSPRNDSHPRSSAISISSSTENRALPPLQQRLTATVVLSHARECDMGPTQRSPLLPTTSVKTMSTSSSSSSPPPPSPPPPSPPPPSPPPPSPPHSAGGIDSNSSVTTASLSPREAGGFQDMDVGRMSRRSRWIILAVASGACAAFNGVFAKLTTTELTTNFALSIAKALGLGNGEKVVEFIIRGIFFALNLLFNGIMWTLFTKALTAGTSTTQVSIINTSSNFMITAVLSFFIFTESLPPLWWLGASLLVAGNVIIGRREEKDTGVLGPTAGFGEGELERERDAMEGEGLLGTAGGEEEFMLGVGEGVKGVSKRGRGSSSDDDDDILDFGLERDKSEDKRAVR